jgi:hypothetical protein
LFDMLNKYLYITLKVVYLLFTNSYNNFIIFNDKKYGIAGDLTEGNKILNFKCNLEF